VNQVIEGIGLDSNIGSIKKALQGFNLQGFLIENLNLIDYLRVVRCHPSLGATLGAGIAFKD